jgi:nitroreductase
MFSLYLLSKKPWLASLYYGVLSGGMRIEHFAVLNGRVAFNGGNSDSLRYLLSRNIHRLEKGMIMRPRRTHFAREYINEAVSTYGKCVTESDAPRKDDQLDWATDVLQKYFDEIEPGNKNIESARDLFLSVRPIARHELPKVPYPRSLLANHSVSYESFYRLCGQRRSVRWYLDKKVDRVLLDKAVEAASLAPSACNRQPFQFRFYDERSLVEKILKTPMGTSGFAENIPTVVVVVGQLRAFHSERDRHLIYIDSALATMSFVLAAETLGLSTCVINWPEIPARENMIRELIDLDSDERIINLISVGWADPEGGVPYSQKKPLDSIRSYNERVR